MIHPSSPRIPAVDKNGKLLWDWRKELSRKRSLRGMVWTFIAFLVFSGFFLLIREVLPLSTFEPHFDISGALTIWVVLSVVFTALAFASLGRLVRMLQASM